MIDDNSKEFINRHIGPSDEDQSKMLRYVGYNSLNDLIINTVPEIRKKFTFILRLIHAFPILFPQKKLK